MDYALFLRGVNVGGIKVPMAELRACLEGLGLEDVRTYVQTGNVTFRAKRASAPAIEKALSARFGYDAHVLLLPRSALAGLVSAYPFAAREDHHRYAVLCASQAVVDELVAAAAPSDLEQIAAGDGVVYWSCPKGSTLKTPFADVLAKKKYKPTTTNRNLNTLEKMLEP
jgi:uncharacterized protein (DUF1697 family)